MAGTTFILTSRFWELENDIDHKGAYVEEGMKDGSPNNISKYESINNVDEQYDDLKKLRGLIQRDSFSSIDKLREIIK